MVTSKYFDYIVEKVAAAKREADVLANGLNHHGLAGQIREIALRNCIAPFLTHSFSCGSGKVIDTFGRVSDQLDLVVYQRKAAPPIMFAHELGLFPVECVRYVFEMKSTLSATEIKDSLKKFNSVKSLRSYPRMLNGTVSYGELPATVLFAFASDITGSEIDRYLKYDAGEYPSATVLCVLGKGYWHWNDGWHGVVNTGCIPPMTEFATFITGFMNTLAAEETSMKPFSPGAYVNPDTVFVGVEGVLERRPKSSYPAP
ncbi:DUF6602 domain-containing protein [Pseudomonas coronafaciens]|uniref:DUF6602 domain-containing protein n=1 Tax=Pseudomonas coronafaciens TaxID=53409 RepID=UPI000EFE9973|nr:DUF6602 domain-containing protein [Pseudomonas coronafaciens]